MSKWEMVRLGDVGNFKSGGTPSRTKPEYFVGNIPWITTVSLGNKYLTESDAVEFISEDAVINSATKIIAANSIMIGVRVGVGKVSINKVPMCTSQDIISIENIDDKKFDKLYLVYCINSFQNHFNSKKRGATIQGINSNVLKSIKIPLPPLAIQQKIASTLDTTAALLALRKQQLAELDALIQSVFVEMFGDPLLNPTGWKSVQLADIAEIVSGITKGRKIKEQELLEVPYMRVGNVKDGHIDLTEIKTIEATQSEIEHYTLKFDDVLMTEGGDPDKLGRGAIWREKIENCIHQNHIFRVRVEQERMLPQYFAEYLRHPKAKRYFLGCAKQTTGIASINMTQLKLLPVLLPPLALQTQFAAIVEKIEQQKALVQQAIEETQTLFDSLMAEYFE